LKRVALVALACARIAGAESRPHYGGLVDASLLGAPVSLDPTAVQTHAEITVSALVFDSLYRIGADGVVQPHLAVALPIFEHGRAKIVLRRGVRFHDGSELTAQDVAASLDRLRGSPARWVLASVTAIKPEGEAVELTLAGPAPELATQLALPQAAITKGGKAPGARPIGTGPFAFESIDRAKRVLALRRFESHFSGPAYLERLVLHWYDTPDAEARQFELGSTQISARGPTTFAGAKPKYAAEYVESPAAVLSFVGFGRRHAAIGDRDFRRALDLALARGALTDISLGERIVGTRMPVPQEAGGPPLDAIGKSGDLAAAKAALAAAAKRIAELDPSQIAKLRLEICFEDTRPDDKAIAERVAFALDQLGIATTITGIPAAALRDRVEKGTCDLWIGQLAEPIGAGGVWWAAAFTAGGDAVPTGDPVKPFTERLPIVPLMFRAVRVWYRSDLRGLGFDTSARLELADANLHGQPSRPRGGP